MANDDWVEEVKRWTQSGGRSISVAEADAFDMDHLGYEAANPALQAQHWPEVPTDSVPLAV